jgi:hypothetical protein
VVSLTPLRQYDTAELWDLEFERLWLPLKEISIKNYIGKWFYPIAITITQKQRGYLRIVFGLSSVIDTAEAKICYFKVEHFYATPTGHTDYLLTYLEKAYSVPVTLSYLHH